MIRYQVLFAFTRAKAQSLAELHPVLLDYLFAMDFKSVADKDVRLFGLIVERWSMAVEHNLISDSNYMEFIRNHISDRLMYSSEAVVVFSTDKTASQDMQDGKVISCPYYIVSSHFYSKFTELLIEGRPFYTGHLAAASMKLLLENRY